MLRATASGCDDLAMIRHMVPELMDAPDLDAALHRQALDGLARLNRFGGGLRILWPAVREVALRLGKSVRVLDVACGGGDIAIYLAQRAQREGLNVEVSGCDLSSTALARAHEHAAAAGLAARFFERDVMLDGLPEGYDVILTSQFLHHLEVDDATRLVREMAARARDTVLVSDLVRGRCNLWITSLACHVLTRSPVVRFDGPQSIRAAFDLREARQLAERAGLAGALVQRRLPVHFLLVHRCS